jgi:hypothetical protein
LALAAGVVGAAVTYFLMLNSMEPRALRQARRFVDRLEADFRKPPVYMEGRTYPGRNRVVSEELQPDIAASWEEHGFVFYLMSTDPLSGWHVLTRALDDQTDPSEILERRRKTKTFAFVVVNDRWAYWVYD